MDFDEHDDQEEEMGMAVPPGYDSLGTLSETWSKPGPTTTGGGDGLARKVGSTTVRYRECLKNHAVSIGGHAVDGCCEFIAAGDEGTVEALKCTACNCHRNFHRKETEGETGYLHLTPPSQYRPLALPAASGGGGDSREEEDVSNPSSSGGGGGSKKRFRTKFTAEQKEKMLDFAEKLGWRIQKHDEAAIQQFCEETGVKRHVLKVWMHNNKNTLGKKP
ncbi:hypothetical protein GOBAR_DD35780 [Gossypium barbadense]|nr:hypothetical protein GOBAR_DD35780 [Gossypium barbadense]